ncbi:MAG: acetyl-CoA carboxylase carboxyltransferase subunit alpha [Planctomycetota bacterium]
MTENPKKPDSGASASELEFERPIIELEMKIKDLEALSQSSGMNLNGQLNPLKARLDKLIQDVFSGLEPWDRVRVARHKERPLTTDYVQLMTDEFVELHGDRLYGDDRAIVTGLAAMDGERFLLVGHRKGKTTQDKIACNFGCAHPEGYRKALQKMKLAEKFGLPIVTLINTPGAYPGIGAEERGQAQAIALNIMEMCRLRVPIICVVIGEGGSGGALGIGVGDRVSMLQYAYYSVISPEGCAAILWKSGEKAPEAAKALRLTADDLQHLGLVDDVIPEPLGGAHRDPGAMAQILRERLLAQIRELKKLSLDELMDQRFEKYRNLGNDASVLAPVAAGGGGPSGEPEPSERESEESAS